jgi:hypothetical protein
MKQTLGVVAFLLCSNTAWAQFAELWFSGGQALLSGRALGSAAVFGGSPNDFELSDGFRFAFRAAFNTPGIFGHEIQYAYNRTHLVDNLNKTETGMAIHQGGYNFLVYATHEGKRVRPFGTGGVHFNNYVPPGSSAASGGGQTKFGVNYGGGVKVRMFSIWALRFDVREYVTPKPFDLYLKQGWLRQNEVSAGFGAEF